MKNIPCWLKENEKYEPSSDRDGFMTKSILSLMSVLTLFRNGSSGTNAYRISFSPCVKLLFAIFLIILCSLSHNMFFTYTVIVIFLVHICFLRSRTLLRVFFTALSATAVSALILLPAVFIGSPETMLTVSIKVFLSAGLLQLAAATSSWNSITSGLRALHVPHIFIFTLDISIKYIFLLGNISLNLLNALKLRAVGKNSKKRESLSGILGITFVKAHAMSGEMSDAMTCRCFEGDYRKTVNSTLKSSDIIAATAAVSVLLFYVFSENL